MSPFLRIVVCCIVAAAAVAFVFRGARILEDPEDLRAFYCAGQAILTHHDPYLAEPLRTCEVRETLAAGLTPYRRLAVPAPLPGYAFAPFVVLALLPFAAASSLYVLSVAAAFGATVLVLRKLVRVPLIAIVAALALSDGVVSLFNGQILPFALLALCACARDVAGERYRRAAVFAALAGVEPHIALPAWIALALCLPKTRAPLAVCGLVLGAVSLAVLGLHENIEYFTHVLPAHARAEASATEQYGLTTFLVRLGVARTAAIAAANLSYAVMCAFGVVVARRLAISLRARELLVLVPPAFALAGGPFVHLTQMAVAIPALLVLLDRLPERRARFAPPLILLALPWRDLVENPAPAMCLAIVAVAGILALRVWKLGFAQAAGVVGVVLALGLAEQWLHVRLGQPPTDATHAIALVDGNGRLAEATWEAFVTLTENSDRRLYLALHLPTWLGIGIMVVAALQAARSTGSRAAPREQQARCPTARSM